MVGLCRQLWPSQLLLKLAVLFQAEPRSGRAETGSSWLFLEVQDGLGALSVPLSSRFLFEAICLSSLLFLFDGVRKEDQLSRGTRPWVYEPEQRGEGGSGVTARAAPRLAQRVPLLAVKYGRSSEHAWRRGWRAGGLCLVFSCYLRKHPTPPRPQSPSGGAAAPLRSSGHVHSPEAPRCSKATGRQRALPGRKENSRSARRAQQECRGHGVVQGWQRRGAGSKGPRASAGAGLRVRRLGWAGLDTAAGSAQVNQVNVSVT